MTRKPIGSLLPFLFLQVTHFSLSNSCLTDETAQREQENHKIQYFLRVLASMTGPRCKSTCHILQVKEYSRFAVSNLPHFLWSILQQKKSTR